jgi:hypothetical protein
VSDLQDLDLHGSRGTSSSPDWSEPPQRRASSVWLAVIALVAAAGVAGYFAFVWRQPGSPAQTTAAKPSAAGTAASPPLGGKGDAITLPPLDQSDTLVRTLVQALTESPAVMAWLPTTGLIRNFTVGVANIADGATPAKHVKVLRPAAPFRIATRGGGPATDPRSYDRYNGIADAVASVDAGGAAKLYATLKPRIEDAYRDLGTPGSFDQTLERAIVALLSTPPIDGSEPLKPKGIGYGYADERLESLTAAQKQLLRMGPRNVRVIKTKLRDIAIALGIPPAHLPPP